MNGSKTHLKYLTIYNVTKLRNIIWTELLPQDFFHKLESLEINECNLFSFAWVVHLPCLYHLWIHRCAEVEELFYVEEKEIQRVWKHPPFPRLVRLDLGWLPKLVSISNFELDSTHLLWFHVSDCVNLKKLPFKPEGINNKKIYIRCDRKWWEGLEWDDGAIPSHLLPQFIDVSFMCSFILFISFIAL